ncbi:MAG: p-hydroxyphenylacetate 3-hydroxylase, reductase component [Candidatus Heimdallarchaeota archaeon LC_2]|nr:MAG: p-hydroxyphenylacetate 3-hydroxylase, reductase component [Candidatus Heimdallarchaeota archaeon LC_2]
MSENKVHVVETFEDKDERKAMWHNTITTVGLVTSQLNGKENVMACEWAIQISFNPPLYLIVVGKSKATAEFIIKTGEFGLTFASDEQATLSHVSGSYSAYKHDKIATNIFPLQAGKTILAPIIKEGMIAVECKVIQMIEVEGRFIFIGEAKYAEYRDDKKPLLYHAGKYFSLGKQIPKPVLDLDI